MSGFIGKVWLLKATLDAEYTFVFWPLYLLVSLAILLSVAKAGSTVFWHHQDSLIESNATESAEQSRVHPAQLAALIILIAGAPLMTIFAGPLSEYAIGAASQLHDFNNNIKINLSGGH